MEKYTRLLSSEHNYKILFLIFLNVIAIFFETVGIALIPIFISILIDPNALELLPFGFINPILNKIGYENIATYGALVLIILFVFKNILTFMLVWFEASFRANLNYTLKKLFFSLYTKSPFQIINLYNSSDIIRNIDNEAQDYISNFFLIIKFGKDFLLFLSIFLLLLFVDFISTLVAITLLLALLISYFLFFKKKLKIIGEKLLISKRNLFKWINQSLGSIKEVKVSRKEYFVLNKFLNHVVLFENSKKIRNIIQGLPSIFFELAFVIVALTVITIIVSSKNAETIGVLSLYIIAGVRLLPIFSKFGSYVTNLRASYPSVLHLNNEFDKLKKYQDSYKIDPEDENEIKINFEKKIIIKDLNFSYDKNINILKNINLEIAKGETVAFVGQSGSGKTTLVNIICGLLKLEKGCMEVDSKIISSDNKNWQKKIGLLSQENYLIDETIKNNIIFLNEDNNINKENLNNAIVYSGLGDLIKSLPHGINTYVGEKGNFLSGGQIKRIALSRLLYRDPEILILDEFTNSLDFEIEDHVLNNIKELQTKKNKTVIMITHKMKPLKICDKIYILKNGQIAEKLSYEEFYNKFSALYN